MQNVNAAIDLVLSGASLTEAIDIFEAKITPETVDDFVNSKAFKGLERNIELMFRDLESNEEYKRGRFTEDPIGSLENEAENSEYVANILRGLDIEGFDTDIAAKAKKLAASLMKGANTIRNKIKKLSKSDFVGPDGKLKMKQVKDKDGNIVYTQDKVDKKTGEIIEPARPKMERDYPYSENVYTGRAIAALAEIFRDLGIDWDYTPEFIKYLNSPIKPGEIPESVQKDIENVINSAFEKGFLDKDALKESLELNESEAAYFDEIWVSKERK